MNLTVRDLKQLAASVLVQLLVLVFVPLAALVRLIFALVNGPRISFWTGTPILTLSQKAASERMMGVRAIVMVRFAYHLSQDFDVVLARWCRSWPFLLYPMTGFAFLILLATASRVHTFADGGLLPAAKRWRFAVVELLAYRFFRIPHMVWTYGADVRTREITRALGPKNCCTDCTQVGKACVCDADEGRRNLTRLRRNGAQIFSMGDMIEYTPGSRNDLFYWPLDLAGAHTVDVHGNETQSGYGGDLRIVHAPNHREFKGTRYLEAAIADLRAEGVPIELVLVEKLPNYEALAIYRTADVIFDQCLIGFHGYFALEAMALGKPVMCYVRKPEQYLLEPQECPIITTHVDTLRDDLRRLVLMRDRLAAIGQRSREYVENHYSRAAFASRLQRAYQEIGITP